MDPLPELKTVVGNLKEVYQPIFGHDEFGNEASRKCEDRLRHIMGVHHALVRQLGRPIRVLDLGCAQGWFGFHLAQAGAQVLGVDYLQDNINVCHMLLLENRQLAIRFQADEIEKIVGTLGDDQFDLVLGLSVFHHLCLHNGKEATRDIVTRIMQKIPTGIFEMALATEQPGFAAAQPEHSDYLIAPQPFYRIIAHHETHLNSTRPLYYCSRVFWYLGGEMGAFDAHADNGRGRRYFFGDTSMAKLYDVTGDYGAINRYAITQAAQFLQSPPVGYEWSPKLVQSGGDENTAWLVQEKIKGVRLSDVITNGGDYDARDILRGVLQQLAQLEKTGLYHADLRVWNIIMGENNFPYLIDYNEISTAKRDCVWPDDIFLAFFLFVNEVVTRRVFDTEPSRPPFISPYNMPQPYRAWLEQTWAKPVSEWHFAFLLATLDAPVVPVADSANALWMQSIEQNIDTLNVTVRSMGALVMRLHDVVRAKKP